MNAELHGGLPYRPGMLTAAPAMVEDGVWRALEPRGETECERGWQCGEQARWTTVQGNLCVCDYHRLVFEIERRADLRLVRNLDERRAA